MSLDFLFKNFPIVFRDDKGGRITERQVNSGSENIIFKVLGDRVDF